MGSKAASKCARAADRASNASSAANRAVKPSTAAAEMGSATAADMRSTAATMTAALRHNACDHRRRAEHNRCSNSKHHPTHQTHLSIIRDHGERLHLLQNAAWQQLEL
jgi:hypothetical protein